MREKYIRFILKIITIISNLSMTTNIKQMLFKLIFRILFCALIIDIESEQFVGEFRRFMPKDDNIPIRDEEAKCINSFYDKVIRTYEEVKIDWQCPIWKLS